MKQKKRYRIRPGSFVFWAGIVGIAAAVYYGMVAFLVVAGG